MIYLSIPAKSITKKIESRTQEPIGIPRLQRWFSFVCRMSIIPTAKSLAVQYELLGKVVARPFVISRFSVEIRREHHDHRKTLGNSTGQFRRYYLSISSRTSHQDLSNTQTKRFLERVCLGSCQGEMGFAATDRSENSDCWLQNWVKEFCTRWVVLLLGVCWFFPRHLSNKKKPRFHESSDALRYSYTIHRRTKISCYIEVSRLEKVRKLKEATTWYFSINSVLQIHPVRSCSEATVQDVVRSLVPPLLPFSLFLVLPTRFFEVHRTC